MPKPKTSPPTLAALRTEVGRLRQIMVFHYITLGDDNQPEGAQGRARQREFFDECNRIIAMQVHALPDKKESTNDH
jgi:hypothetical protein